MKFAELSNEIQNVVLDKMENSKRYSVDVSKRIYDIFYDLVSAEFGKNAEMIDCSFWMNKNTFMIDFYASGDSSRISDFISNCYIGGNGYYDIDVVSVSYDEDEKIHVTAMKNGVHDDAIEYDISVWMECSILNLKRDIERHKRAFVKEYIEKDNIEFNEKGELI